MIYICAHKDYQDIGINNPEYKIISGQNINNNSKLDLVKRESFSDKIWCEFANHMYIWKNNLNNEPYIGFCHYRRYFDFMNNIPDNPELILPMPIRQRYNNAMMYGIYHNINDFITVGNIINSEFKQYVNAFTAMSDSHDIIPYNMFIMNSSLFNDYMEFVGNVLTRLQEVKKIDTVISGEKYVSDNSALYLKSFYPNNTIEYQLRSIFGGMAERLGTAFYLYLINKKHIKPTFTNVNVTNHTYNTI